MNARALVAALGLCTLAAGAHAGALREWRFDVTLDGRPIGEHRFVLRDGDGVGNDERELTSEANFRVRVLFIDAYRYEHRAREWWRGDCLERLDARTDVNGKRTAVTGTLDAGSFRLAGAPPAPPDACVQTFAYWNPSILDARRLLNPQTGEFVPIKVLLMGRETLDGQATDRYKLVGSGPTPLEIDVWYTPARDWWALESRTPEGHRLRYERKHDNAN